MKYIIKQLQENKKFKIICFLNTNYDTDYPISEIAKKVKLSRQMAYVLIEELIKHDIVVKTRKLANMQLYQINGKSKDVELWIEIENAIHLIKYKKITDTF